MAIGEIRQHVTFSYEGSCVKKNALIVVREDIYQSFGQKLNARRIIVICF